MPTWCPGPLGVTAFSLGRAGSCWSWMLVAVSVAVVSGTFGGDCIALAACRAVLDEYAIGLPNGRSAVIDALWRRGQEFMRAARIGIDAWKVPFEVVGRSPHPVIRCTLPGPEGDLW